MKTFSLPTGETVTVDDEDYERVTALRWCRQKKPSGAMYAHRTYKSGGKRYVVRLARFILGDVPAERFVDHINGDGLDNRRSNLRIVSNRENLVGFKRKKKTATSRFRGVCWYAARGKWFAQLGLRGRKDNYIGYFDSEIEAARAYNARAISEGYFPEALNAV